MLSSTASAELPAQPPRKTRCLSASAVPGATRAEDREQAALDALARAEGRLKLCERQLVELDHRLANTLQIASGLIRRQQSRVADPLAKEALGAAITRLEAMARLHLHFCRHGAPQGIDLGRFIEEIAPAIEAATGLRCELDIEPAVEVPGQAALHLAIAVTELVLNARKHAYGGQDGGLVRIACRRDPDRRLRLSVADRGRGLPRGFDPQHLGTGLGMGIIGAAARQLGGELRADSDRGGGARFTLLLALP